MVELPLLRLMPRITKYFIRFGLLYFVLDLFFLLISESGWLFQWNISASFQPVYYHFFLFGWVLQIIIGVSLWMFPWSERLQIVERDRHGMVVLVLVNSGLILRGISEPMVWTNGDVTWRWLLVLSAILMWAGGMIYAAHIWRRIRVK